MNLGCTKTPKTGSVSSRSWTACALPTPRAARRLCCAAAPRHRASHPRRHRLAGRRQMAVQHEATQVKEPAGKKRKSAGAVVDVSAAFVGDDEEEFMKLNIPATIQNHLMTA